MPLHVQLIPHRKVARSYNCQRSKGHHSFAFATPHTILLWQHQEAQIHPMAPDIAHLGVLDAALQHDAALVETPLAVAADPADHALCLLHKIIMI